MLKKWNTSSLNITWSSCSKLIIQINNTNPQTFLKNCTWIWSKELIKDHHQGKDKINLNLNIKFSGL